MFRFAYPYSFFLLIPVAIAAWAVYRRRVNAGILFSAFSRLAGAGTTWRTAAGNLLPLATLLGLALIVVALARPQTVMSRTHRSVDAIAIEMVVDVSGSMEALDLSPRTPTGVKFRTRLDIVKEVFADFIARRPDDLIGLVTFGGYAVTRAPLTTDHEALRHVLEGIEIPKQSFDREGRLLNQEELLTAIGDALTTALARLKTSEPRSRIVVLLSDGESNTGLISPDQAIQAARTLGIRIYTIGVGTTGVAPFRGRDAFGREQIFRQEVTLDEALLRRVADATNARYFNVRDARGLEDAMGEIDTLEKTRVERDVYHHYNERFPWLLWPALVLILLGTGLNMVLTRRII